MRSILKHFALLACYVVFSFLSAQQRQPDIRFAWLSDIHVGSSTGDEDLRLAVQDINGMDDIDFAVLSGDITEVGRSADLERAKAILDSLNRPYHIIPGNHDTKWSESGATAFGQLWGSDKFVFEFGGFLFIGLHQGPLMRMGDGHFSPEDLRWLDSVLVNLSYDNQSLIFVTHYPVDPSIDNWYELLDRARRFDTKVILTGHGHRNRAMSFEGIPGVMGRSTLRAGEPLGGYNIVEVYHDSLLFFERITGGKTSSSWHSISLEDRDYSSDTTQYDRPEFSINEEFPQVSVKWTFDTGYTIASSPVVWEDHVVVGNSSGRIYGISLDTGTEQWSYRTGSAVYSTPDISKGKAVFGSADGRIYCLEVSNGKLVWKYPTPAPVVAAPSIEWGIVFIGGSDGTFRAIDLNTGEQIWQFDGVGDFVETRPLVYRGKVIFGAWDTYLYSLEAGDGALAWKWSNGSSAVLYSPAACWPVASDNKVFVVAPDRFMTAIDVKTGEPVWRSSRHQVREAIGISEDLKTVYARCMTDTLLAFSADSSSPHLLWATPCGYGYDIDPSMPVEKDGVVFFGTKNGLVIAVDGETGALRWKHRVGVALVNTVFPVDAHRVVVTDMDGRVMMVESK